LQWLKVASDLRLPPLPQDEMQRTDLQYGEFRSSRGKQSIVKSWVYSGDIWKIIEIYGKLWKNFGKLWKYMENYGKS
jgi:hypothetical protein